MGGFDQEGFIRRFGRFGRFKKSGGEHSEICPICPICGSLLFGRGDPRTAGGPQRGAGGGGGAGGGALAENNICSLTPYIPEKAPGAEADYTIEVGQTVELDGYDTVMQTCAADDPGIVSVSELPSGEGWELRGLAVGTTIVRVFDDPDYYDEIAAFTLRVVEEASAPAGPAVAGSGWVVGIR